MAGTCYPDRLIQSIPNLYYYAANNPSEATIAKRRSYATTISYLTPPAENAGLYKGLKELGELVSSYQSLRLTGRAANIVSSIIATARQCNLDKDVDLPDDDADMKESTQLEKDDIVGKVYGKIMEIESRLLPCGLHTVGVPPTAEEAIATLVNIVSIDRPEDEIKSLPRIIAETLNKNIDQLYKSETLEDVTLKTKITEVNPMMSGLQNMMGGSPMKQALKEVGFEVADEAMTKTFEYCEFCLKQVVADNEMGALLEGLNAEFITPGPGGDPIRNPLVLPTGKNMHALDPSAIPTSAAMDCAKNVVDLLLERQKEGSEDGLTYPSSVAFVLWGTDNIN